MRPEAGASSMAMGVRSPIDMASPREAFVIRQRHGAIRHRQLPGADHLVAAGQAANGAVADGDQEGLVGHRGVAQHAVGGFSQVDAGQVQRRGHAGQTAHVARHARRLARDHVDRHVPRGALRRRLAGGWCPRPGRPSPSTTRSWRSSVATPTTAYGQRSRRRDGVKAFQVLRQDRQDIAFLRFIAPDFGGRQARLFQRHALQVEDGATAGVVDQFREGVGQTARANVVDGDDGVVHGLLPAAVDDFLRTALDFRVAALDGIEVQLGRVATHADTGGGAAAHADTEARAAQLDQQRAGGNHVLVGQGRVDAAQATRDHDGLVVAPARAAGGLLERAEVAQQVGPTEFVVERRAADGARRS